MPTFIPPAIHEGIEHGRGLWRHYTLARGITVAIHGGEATTVRFPSQEYLDGADEYFLGGHEYEITDTQAAVLTAAGFGDYIS